MRIEELYQCFLQCDGVSTDTRNITPNSLFIALKGDNFDANQFAEEALKKGALFAIVDNKKYHTDKEKMLLVSNSLETLQLLAKYHREQLGLPVIALTGSNGKTTTKELIATVLAAKYNIAATIGNLNNHIGVPLTLLSFNDDTDIGIVEMGANHIGEIAHLCQIAQPDYGYITNFGRAHLEGFGGFEGVIKAKSELYDYLEDNSKIAFANTDDPRQDAKTLTFSRYTFGLDESNDLVIKSYSAQPNATVELDNHTFTSKLTGIYNSTNIAVAIAFGKYFGIDLEVIKNTISQFTPNNNRSQWLQKGSNDILLDAYNANPSSMEVAISNFLQLDTTKNKIIILGDMFELGKESGKEHTAIIERLKEHKDITNYNIGSIFFQYKTDESNQHFFKSFEDFSKALENKPLFKDSLILIKGSRGMALERILEYIN